MSALFLVQPQDLRNPVRSRMLEKYDVLVCNAECDLDKLRELAPKADLLTYVDMTTVPNYGADDGIYGDLRRLTGRHFLRNWGSVVTNSYGNIELQLTFDAYDDYASWIKENLGRWDGVYLDQCWSSADPNWVEATGRDLNETSLRWRHLRDYFIENLRARSVGRIVGNTGRVWAERRVPRGLAGFCAEQVHINETGAAVDIKGVVQPGEIW